MSEDAQPEIRSTELVLHIWPAQWELPSLDPQCIAVILYLQLTFPGRYSVVECTDPDQSPSGQLPFLTHEHTEVSPLPSIIAYLESLARVEAQTADVTLDAKIKLPEAHQAVAWKAYIVSELGDILAHQLFVEHYWTFTHRSLAKLMAFPQRLYLPSRLRKMYQPRLEAIGMWDAHFIEEPEATKPITKAPQQTGIPPAQAFKHAFAREKLLDKARKAFDLLSAILNENEFIYGDSATTTDVIMAAYILPMLYIPFPGSRISTELRTSYNSLALHAERILEIAQSKQLAPTLETPTVRSSLSAVFNSWRKETNVFAQENDKTPPTKSNFAAKYGKWMFGLVAGVGSLAYLIVTGIVSIQNVEEDEDDIASEIFDLEEEVK
ncbi:Tom37 carboxy-terminal domain protein [Rhizoctonia solani AG-3 Rhs1AP]|uniref:Tom37 carboxy-terminal domain protein n=2 Tax=Rhizoctonia solani AG-3 TaxID=1086053 RepID=A0A074S7B8_9AGAM|nr:Tom37 carboxy-terminal domain protein [Rhizoctonia solani AG-3 Rhs1AP]KEP55291.1 Tom37 carboxy-terminal domain protein [Rhizoctonia solani 123E]